MKADTLGPWDHEFEQGCTWGRRRHEIRKFASPSNCLGLLRPARHIRWKVSASVLSSRPRNPGTYDIRACIRISHSFALGYCSESGNFVIIRNEPHTCAEVTLSSGKMWRTAYWAVALQAVLAPCFAQILTTPKSGNRLIFVPQGIGAALIKPEVHVIDLGAGAQPRGELRLAYERNMP